MKSQHFSGINAARDAKTANVMAKCGILRTITRNMCRRLIAPSQSDKRTLAIDREAIVSYTAQIYYSHSTDNGTNQILIQVLS